MLPGLSPGHFPYAHAPHSTSKPEWSRAAGELRSWPAGGERGPLPESQCLTGKRRTRTNGLGGAALPHSQQQLRIHSS